MRVTTAGESGIYDYSNLRDEVATIILRVGDFALDIERETVLLGFCLGVVALLRWFAYLMSGVTGAAEEARARCSRVAPLMRACPRPSRGWMHRQTSKTRGVGMYIRVCTSGLRTCAGERCTFGSNGSIQRIDTTTCKDRRKNRSIFVLSERLL
ncbi:hypothetical protein PQR39_40990 [Paraburkholderia sediminicola]|uniref:hypothetical protein n=1 Tax=Paraburkholderia sediminicola TaxID=458836 RepID=UPI0038BB0878